MDWNALYTVAIAVTFMSSGNNSFLYFYKFMVDMTQVVLLCTPSECQQSDVVCTCTECDSSTSAGHG